MEYFLAIKRSEELMNTPHTGESLDHYAKFEKDTKDQIMCDANHRKC